MRMSQLRLISECWNFVLWVVAFGILVHIFSVQHFWFITAGFWMLDYRKLWFITCKLVCSGVVTIYFCCYAVLSVLEYMLCFGIGVLIGFDSHNLTSHFMQSSYDFTCKSYSAWPHLSKIGNLLIFYLQNHLIH